MSFDDYEEAKGDPIYTGLLVGAYNAVRGLLGAREGDESERQSLWHRAMTSIDTAQNYANTYSKGDSLLERLRDKIGL